MLKSSDRGNTVAETLCFLPILYKLSLFLLGLCRNKVLCRHVASENLAIRNINQSVVQEWWVWRNTIHTWRSKTMFLHKLWPRQYVIHCYSNEFSEINHPLYCIRFQNYATEQTGWAECPLFFSPRQTISRIGGTMSVSKRYFLAWSLHSLVLTFATKMIFDSVNVSVFSHLSKLLLRGKNLPLKKPTKCRQIPKHCMILQLSYVLKI